LTAEPHHFGLAPPCGRYSLRSKPEVIAEEFDLPEVPLFEPRFNIPPNQPAAVVRFDSNEGTRRLDLLPSSLVPFWTDDLSIGNRLINARSESVAEKPWQGI
jgi:putative SOS response-associated peptidase YedK